MSRSGLGGNLTDVDRRMSPVGSCSPGHNPGGQFGDKDASPRADVAFSSGRVLSWLSTGTDKWYEKLVWMPFKQAHNVVSGNVDFDSFGMAPWDAGGMHGDRFQLHEVIHTIMSQWSMRPLSRPVIVHGLYRNTTMNTENELDMIILINTDSPRLTVTPGE